MYHWSGVDGCLNLLSFATHNQQLGLALFRFFPIRPISFLGAFRGGCFNLYIPGKVHHDCTSQQITLPVFFFQIKFTSIPWFGFGNWHIHRIGLFRKPGHICLICLRKRVSGRVNCRLPILMVTLPSADSINCACNVRPSELVHVRTGSPANKGKVRRNTR